MGNWIICEECEERMFASSSNALDRDTFYEVRTISGAEVGHYCSPEHAQKGIEAWDQMIRTEGTDG